MATCETLEIPILKAPFPWFGGKSRVAHIAWSRFGNTVNYVEPFAGSLAVLLGRPHAPGAETVNDKDCYLANFWRAIQAEPEAVEECADWPVNEADLHARHLWLVKRDEFRERMKTDPDYFDAKIAGWWVWGICQWIGAGWCSTMEGNHVGRTAEGGVQERRPKLKDTGINTVPFGRTADGGCKQQLPREHRVGIHKLPSGRTSGGGVWDQIPNLKGGGQGVHRKRPYVSSGNRGAVRSAELIEWFYALANRLRRVRVCCGDWNRILGPSVTEKLGVTAVFLDPPYSAEAGRDGDLYGSSDDLSVAHSVREWAIANGSNPMLRIALCGYEGEHGMPDDWECVSWKGHGGYAALKKGEKNQNRFRERIWFSPACLKQAGLFG